MLGSFALLARDLVSSSLLLSLLLDLGKLLLVRLVLSLLGHTVFLGTLCREAFFLGLLSLLTDESLFSFPLLLLLGLLLPRFALLACPLFPFPSLLVGLFLAILLFLLPFLLFGSDPSLFFGLCTLCSLAFDAILLCALLTIAFSLLRLSLNSLGFGSRSSFSGKAFLLELLLLLPDTLASMVLAAKSGRTSSCPSSSGTAKPSSPRVAA